MLTNYLPILLFLMFATVIAVGAILAGKIVGTVLKNRNPSQQKLSPYECGFGVFEDARARFDIKFYLIAILFIVFDLEVAFLFPFAVTLRNLPHAALGAVALFLGLLIVGFIYEWKKGALEWE